MRRLPIVLLLAASPALAREPSVEFDFLDLDGDGYLTLAEAAGLDYIVTKFDRADVNRDGRLSPEEFAAMDRIRVRATKVRRERVRAMVARDSAAAAREGSETEDSAAVGGSAKPAGR